MTAGQRWAAELARAMRRRGWSNVRLAREAGMSAPSISAYRTARQMPTLTRAAILSDVLMWPDLLERRVAMATRDCAACGRSFIDAGTKGNGRFCGSACRWTNRTRLARGKLDARREVTTRRLHLFEARVAVMCGDCTLGDGVCRTEECPLRAVSPLRFVRMSAA